MKKKKSDKLIDIIDTSDEEDILGNNGYEVKQRGGKRNNAGRKKKSEPTKPLTFRTPVSLIENVNLHYTKAEVSKKFQQFLKSLIEIKGK